MSTLFPLKLYCGIKEECLSLTQTDTCIMTSFFKSDCVQTDILLLDSECSMPLVEQPTEYLEHSHFQ